MYSVAIDYFCSDRSFPTQNAIYLKEDIQVRHHFNFKNSLWIALEYKDQFLNVMLWYDKKSKNQKEL